MKTKEIIMVVPRDLDKKTITDTVVKLIKLTHDGCGESTSLTPEFSALLNTCTGILQYHASNDEQMELALTAFKEHMDGHIKSIRKCLNLGDKNERN